MHAATKQTKVAMKQRPEKEGVKAGVMARRSICVHHSADQPCMPGR